MARDHYLRDPQTSRGHRWQNHTSASARDKCQQQYKLQLLSLTLEVSVSATAIATELWASTGHCPYLPGSLCSLALPRDPWPRANFPGRMQFASGCSNFLQASATTGTTNTSPLCLLFPSLPLAWVSKWALISLSCCFCPFCLDREQTMEGGLQTVGQTKLGQKQSWAPGAVWPNKMKGICACSDKSSGVNPCNCLGKLCIWGISQ